MNIFTLESYILDRIETVVNNYITLNSSDWEIDFLQFQPSDGYINTLEKTGAICLYTKKIDYGDYYSGGEFQTVNSLVVDCIGIGDIIETTEDDETVYTTDELEASRRAQILTTLVYYAIMDRQQEEGSATVSKNFGSGIDIRDLRPVACTKATIAGGMVTTRAITAYRNEYSINLNQDRPYESESGNYDGYSSLTIETTNPD